MEALVVGSQQAICRVVAFTDANIAVGTRAIAGIAGVIVGIVGVIVGIA